MKRIFLTLTALYLLIGAFAQTACAAGIEEEEPDFSAMSSAADMEKAYNYQTYYLPSKDLFSQPYVGDPMPYYEDGVYYIYYLKEGGDSLNHSLYLATTTDFVTYTEIDDPIIAAGDESDAQDNWVGTGSVVKIDYTYYLFYTGHASASDAEYKEKILLAKGSDLYSFEKVEGWELIPDPAIGQKNDFRDPQAYYDPETETVTMTVTAAVDGVARILKYTLPKDLSSSTYEGIIFTNEGVTCWNLECSDTFCIDGTWYLTYSAQDDTLWYASSDSQYGPYSPAKRLEGRLFYAAKHVENDENAYMTGWARRADPVSSNRVTAWAGNLVTQKLVKRADGSLVLVPVDAVKEAFSENAPLLIDGTEVTLAAGEAAEVFRCGERTCLSGAFSYSESGTFGLSFAIDDDREHDKKITIDPEAGKIVLSYEGDRYPVAETAVELTAGNTYTFTLLQEGSVGVFYIDGEAALTVRLYGTTGRNVSLFAGENTVEFSDLA